MKRKLLSLAPGLIKDQLFRYSLHIEPEVPNGLTVRIAQTRSDLEEVFNLVNSPNLQTPNQPQMNATLLMPNSTIVMVHWYGRIVGTLTHVLDTQIGLPIELNDNIQQLRAQGRYLGEITGLAIDRSIASKDFVLFLMYRFLHQFTMQHFKVDTWVMHTSIIKKSFYHSVLGFQEVRDTSTYNNSNNKDEVVLYLDLNTFEDNLKKIYSKRRHSKNLYNLFFYSDFNAIFSMPAAKYYKAWTHLHHPGVVREFLIHRADALQKMSPQAMTSFLNFYNAIADHQDFEEIHRYSFYQRSVERRYQVNCPAFLVSVTNATIDQAHIMNVSKNGFMLTHYNDVLNDHTYSFFVDVGPGKRVAITAKACWVNSDRSHCGFQILTSAGEEWANFIDWLAWDSNQFEDLKSLAVG
jgi:hypothetical protein